MENQLPESTPLPSSLSESESSFSMLASAPSSIDPCEVSDESSSDDVVVWTGNEFDSDEDFILIPHDHSLSLSHSHSSALSDRMARLSFVSEHIASQTQTPSPATPTSSSQPKPNAKAPGAKTRQSVGARVSGQKQQMSIPVNSNPPSSKTRKSRRKKGEKASSPSPSPEPNRGGRGGAAVPFGSHPLVESDAESEPVLTKYEEAASFITFFLSNPSAALSCSACTRLTFLQSLIIELGLLTPSSSMLPSSLTAAKRFLKTHAFINIGDYLNVRQQGIQKIREIMFKSKKALANDLKKNKGHRRADRGWVKRHGLNVLLVSVF